MTKSGSEPQSNDRPLTTAAVSVAAAGMTAWIHVFGLLGNAADGLALFILALSGTPVFAVAAAAAATLVLFAVSVSALASLAVDVPDIHAVIFLVLASVAFATRRGRSTTASPLSRALAWWPPRTRGLCTAMAVLSLAAAAFSAIPLRTCALLFAAFLAMRWCVRAPARASHARRHRLATAATLTLAILAGLALLEIGVRLTIPLAVSARHFWVYDPEYIFRMRPGIEGRHYFWPELGRTDSVAFQISDQGLRDEFIPPKPPNEYRIALLGDSYAYGACVELEDTIGRQLQAILRARYPNRRIRVMNFGSGGTGPWQQHGLLLNTGFALQPDLVLHQLLMSNDVANELSRYEQFLDAYWLPSEDALDRFLLRRLARFRVESWLDEHSDAYAVASRILGKGHIYETLRAGIRFLPAPPRRPRPPHSGRHYVMEVELAEWYPMLDRGWQLLVDSVEATAQDCRQRDIDYAVFVAPYREEILDEEWDHFSAVPDDGTTYERGKGHRLTSQAMRERGIAFIPTFDRMRAATDPASFYFEYDGHYTAAGNRATAEILAEYVEQLGVLEDAPEDPAG